MPVLMETAAFKAILYGTLSCQCPVTEETERALFAEYFRCRDREIVDFAPVRAIADRNPARTPVHNMFEIASYGHDDPESFTITTGDALRALGSKFHFNNLARGLDHLTVKDAPSFLVSHMLVPVRLTGRSDGLDAAFNFAGREITFENVFFPPGLARADQCLYAVHMGAVICRLTEDQAAGLNRHLGLIPEFAFLCGQFSRVDFRDFQYYGDYFSQIEGRFRRHFSF